MWKQTNLHQVTPADEDLDEDSDAGAATAKGKPIPVKKSNHGTQASHARKKKNLE